jgi:NTE family protein
VVFSLWLAAFGYATMEAEWADDGIQERTMTARKASIRRRNRRGQNPVARTGRPAKCKIALALQGGGAHGAFTWGVLDRLLEEPSLEIEAISGTSAGAMNAAVLADGLRRGGRDEARAALRRYWDEVGRMPGLASFVGPSLVGAPGWNFANNPLFFWFELFTHVWSPYETNPLNYNPLRAPLDEIDFEGLRHDPEAIRVFVCATDVRTGRRRVFGNSELSIDALLASACLPNVFKAVEIDGEAYWDGGYTGNPALSPLYLETSATDVVVVGINPLFRDSVPHTAQDIIDRVDEISFNSTFMLELSAIAFVNQLLDSEQVDPSHYRRLMIHGIEAQAALNPLGARSKFNTDPAFLRHLHDIGRSTGSDWIERHRDALGKRCTVDMSGLVPLRSDFGTRSIHDVLAKGSE